MIDKNSAEFACGQIVYNVKESQLNYIVKETPYSTYITIRKTFRKDTNLSNSQEQCELSTDVFNDNIKNLKSTLVSFENENEELKKRVNDKLCDIGRLEFRNEELEVNLEKLESEKIDSDDKIEELYREISELKKSRSSLVLEESIESSKNKDKAEALAIKLNKSQKNLKEVTDNVLILENIIQNKVLEIELLNSKFRTSHCQNCEKNLASEKDLKAHIDSNHSDENVPSTSKCDNYDYKSDEEKDMNDHIYTTHTDAPSSLMCGSCSYTSECEIELQIHKDSTHRVFCDFCGFFSQSEDSLDQHCILQHNFSCPTCTNI